MLYSKQDDRPLHLELPFFKLPRQVKSINDFTSSLAKTLVEAEGMPSKEATDRHVVMIFC